LHIIALLGGFWGIIVGAFLFHHKTSKREFWPPVLFAAALWIGLFFAIVFGYIPLKSLESDLPTKPWRSHGTGGRTFCETPVLLILPPLLPDLRREFSVFRSSLG